MDLVEHQRKIRGLIKARFDGSDDEDPYIRDVAGSEGLALIREISAWWRMIGIEKSSVLTPRLLKQMGIFDQTVETFVDGWVISPFVEHAAHAFLDAMSHHTDPLIAAVAGFELALIRVKQGDDGEYLVEWPCNPEPVVHSLIGDTALPPRADDEVPHRIVVSAEIPGLFRIETVGGGLEAPTPDR